MSGWALPLRIARREAWRAKGRSLLVLVLVSLPVLAVTAAAVLVATVQVSPVESLERRLGAAEARVDTAPDPVPVLQHADPDGGAVSTGGPGSQALPQLDGPAVSEALGGAPVLELRRGETRVLTDDGATSMEATEVDLADPLTRGLVELTRGRWPTTEDEVVVNQALLDQGYAVGDRLRLQDDDRPSPVVVGVAESAETVDLPVAAGPIGSLGVDNDGATSWLVGGGPVTWDQVRELNAAGSFVLSRAVVEDPPPAGDLPEDLPSTGGSDPVVAAVVALVVAMVLLEVVLLAGPAFAVGARRQARSLALMASSGATPAQVRRTVLATGVVLGGVGTAAGVVLGLLTAVAALPFLQRLSGERLGPFDVPWLGIVAVAVFGLASALLAALAPAVLVSRQDVVAVLHGRRGEARPSRVSPVVGGVLLGCGAALAAYGALTRGSEVAVAFAAVLCVLGTVLLVPLVLALLGRLAGRLPLPLRYAVRDGARQRSRTAPAVAAVAATVAGVVTLGIAGTSDGTEDRETYRPQLVMGAGVVTPGWTGTGEPVAPDWDRLEAAVQRELPAATLTAITGLGPAGGDTYVTVSRPGSSDPVATSYSAPLGAAELVGTAGLDALPSLPATVRDQVDEALADGRAVVFADRAGGGDEAALTVERISGHGTSEVVARETVRATYVAAGYDAPAQLLLPTELARELGPTRTVALLVGGTDVGEVQEEAVDEAVQAMGLTGGFYVERGYQPPDADRIVMLVLFALGAVLVLGGTLTATFLALSDAAPDLATLAAVGASPRLRRGVAASYALLVGLVGAVLGAVVGFVPGLAIAVPLTSQGSDGVWTVEGGGAVSGVPPVTGPFLDVPWLLVLGLVVVLPLLSALAVGLLTRSRLPLVARAA